MHLYVSILFIQSAHDYIIYGYGTILSNNSILIYLYKMLTRWPSITFLTISLELCTLV